MWNDPMYLQGCYQLHQHGFLAEWEIGSTVARGFADLGFEEFVLLPQQRLLSIYTGQITALKEGEERHLFSVPTAEAFIDLLSKNGIEVSLICPCKNGWRVEARKAESAEVFGAEDRKLLHALLELSFLVFQIDKRSAKRSLKTQASSQL